jgi:hypothetical protein
MQDPSVLSPSPRIWRLYHAGRVISITLRTHFQIPTHHGSIDTLSKVSRVLYTRQKKEARKIGIKHARRVHVLTPWRERVTGASSGIRSHALPDPLDFKRGVVEGGPRSQQLPSQCRSPIAPTGMLHPFQLLRPSTQRFAVKCAKTSLRHL